MLFHGSVRLSCKSSVAFLCLQARKIWLLLVWDLSEFEPYIFCLGLSLDSPDVSLFDDNFTGYSSCLAFFFFVTAVSSASCAQYYLPDLVAAHGTPNYSDLLFSSLSLVLNVCRALMCFSQCILISCWTKCQQLPIQASFLLFRP